MKSIVLGGGCFWCTEAAYQEIEGVVSVVPGYAGGHTAHPTYEAVCAEVTGHAEVVKVDYDEKIISLEKILTIFFLIHDPTSLNRQGADVGTQYRSAIYYEDGKDKEAADEFIRTASEKVNEQIVTEVAPLDAFYEAEEYHHNYFQNHPEQAYCLAVIEPKLSKLRAFLNKS